MSTPSKSLSTKENKIDNVVRKTSKYTLIILVIIVIAILLTRIIKKLVNENNNKIIKKSGVKSVDSYYTPVPSWGTSTAADYYYPEKNGFPVLGTKGCQVYTYENIYAENEFGSVLDVVSDSKPNVNTVFEDYVNGLNHTGGLIGLKLGCLTQDQIYAQNITRKCNSSNSKYTVCYDSRGSVTASGASVSFPVECSSEELPICAGRLGSISLNFEIEDKKINQQTRCLGVSTIKVPSKLFKDSRLDYYKEDGIIEEDDSLKGKNYYPVTLVSDICNTRSSKQKFLITNYRFGVTQETGGDTSTTGNTFSVDNEGIYTSIIYKPLNAYLDMEFSNTGGIASLEIGVSGTGYSNGEQDITLFGSHPNAKGGRVTVVTEGSNGAVGSLIISELGEGYQQGVSGFVNGTTGKKAIFVITSVYKTNPQFVLRPLPNSNPNFVDIKWLYFPSLDLSSARFPAQQRCNFINPFSEGKKKDKRYSLLSSPLEQDTVFIESNFNKDIVGIGSGYCSNGVSFYPELTFRNLTQGGRLNPFNDYQYNVLSNRGNQAGQKNIHPFELRRKDTRTNFSPGNTFRDGTAEILVEDFSKNICQFPSEYFKDTRGAVLSISPNQSFTPNPGYNPIYKQSTTGLISSVIVDTQPGNQQGFLTGSYQGVSVTSGVGTSAAFNIEVSAKFNLLNFQLVPEIKVTGIANQGGNYQVEEILTIFPPDIGLCSKQYPKLKVEKTELEKFIFTSIPMDSNYNLDPDPEFTPRNDYPNRDFTVAGTIDSNNNFEIFQDLILDRGFGMTPGYTMWMIQLDINSGGFISQENYNNLKNYITKFKGNTTKVVKNPRFKRDYYPALIGIVPDSVQENEYSGSIQAPVTLGVSQNKTVEFNFLQDSKMKLNPSPQQMIYGGQITIGNVTLTEEFAGLNINDVKGITNYFLSQKSKFDTDVVYLKSLQYPSLGYSETSENQVNTNTPIILGKFIPYSSFTPMTRSRRRERGIDFASNIGFNDVQKEEFLGLPEITEPFQYNNNYTQIIPYGLDEVYNTDIKYNKESGSNNPYNNIIQG